MRDAPDNAELFADEAAAGPVAQARFSLGKEGSVGHRLCGALGVSGPMCGKRPRRGQPRRLNSGKVIDYRDISR